MRIFVKDLIKNYLENFYIKRLEKNEYAKFTDPRRKRIYEKIELTKQQKKDIDTFYLENLDRKIPYTWHKYYTAYTGNFDYKYFPESLYIPKFEYFMNYNRSYKSALADKNFLPMLAKSAGIKTPKCIVSRTFGLYRNSENEVIDKREVNNILNNIGKVFAKITINSSSGRGCQLLKLYNGVDAISNKKIEDILDSFGSNFVIQECINCSDSIKKIYPDSVNTFRIITYRWKNSFRALPIIMRIGRGGSFLDNAHAGGMFIAVDSNGNLSDKVFTEFNKQYTEHPDSGLKFKGYHIGDIQGVVNAAIKLHSYIPQLGCINWDFTIDETDSPILIEANIMGGSIWLIEMAHGKGPFGEYTAEILQWIRKMEKMNIEERKKHLFGL